MDEKEMAIPSVNAMMAEKNGPDHQWFEAMWTTVFTTVPEAPDEDLDCPQCAFTTKDSLTLIEHINGNHGPNQYYPFDEIATIPFTGYKRR